MHIRWDGSTSKGPSATPPYSLVIYTSVDRFAWTLDLGMAESNYDFTIPFAQGSQFDVNGFSGGCQRVLYVVKPRTPVSQCLQNNTLMKSTPLAVDAFNAGPLSKSGWPTQELQLDSLAHLGPFFLSITDALHNAWSVGPLHSGQGDSSCLAGDMPTVIRHGVAAGAGLGGLAFGFVVGATGVWFTLFRSADRRSQGPPVERPLIGGRPSSSATASQRSALLDRPPPLTLPDSRQQESERNVYVVHRDGGPAAPVRVYYEGDDEEIVELPAQHEDERATRDGVVGRRKPGRGERAGEQALASGLALAQHQRTRQARKPCGPR
ncbi:hypothetical protein HDZ31DRAFT_63874 [Schizophyllum fasciatum]